MKRFVVTHQVLDRLDEIEKKLKAAKPLAVAYWQLQKSRLEKKLEVRKGH
jgi:hypothetical protein